MTEALRVLSSAVSLAFILLGFLTLRDYLRHPDRSRGLLALAIGLLAVTSIIGQIQAGTMTPLVMVVTPLLDAQSVKEFVELARAKPGALTYASSGTGNLRRQFGC